MVHSAISSLSIILLSALHTVSKILPIILTIANHCIIVGHKKRNNTTGD